MRHILLLVITAISVIAYGQNKSSKVTVIFLDNQNPNFQITTDTLLKAKKIDLSGTPIDLFFANENFHLPYYVPTDGIFKNTAKAKECDWKIYPQTVKCYEYDSLNRVIKMTVSGSGTENNFTYKYNDKDQIIEVADYGHDQFILTYNSDGTLSELKENNVGIEKRLIFIYN